MDGINENKPGKVGILTRFLAIILVASLIVAAFSGLTERKDSAKKYRDFLDNAKEVDVFFLGSSHILNAVDPAQLYYETGITSYNFGKHGGMLPESYWTFKLASQYVKPKCVVVDIWSLDRDYKYVDIMSGEDDDTRNTMSLLHTNLDVWPLSKTKINAINDLLSNWKTRMEYYFKFSLYHGRWSSLGKEDFAGDKNGLNDDTYLLGAEARREIFINHNMYEPDDKSGIVDDNCISAVYLRKIIEECQSQGIDVLLTFMPMGGLHYQDYQAVNYGKALSDEYGIEFVNLIDKDSQSVIDFLSDMSDDSHVNEFGMSKITSYLGQRLSEYENLQDHRNTEGYEMFDEAVNLWRQKRESNLLSQKDLYMTLGYLEMMDKNFVMYLRGDSNALSDEYIRHQIAKISGTDRIEEAKDLGGPYILIKEKDPSSGEAYLYEAASENQEENIPVIQGNAEYIGLKNYGALYYNGDYDNNLFDMDENYHMDVQLFIIGDDGETEADKYFEVGWQS